MAGGHLSHTRGALNDKFLVAGCCVDEAECPSRDSHQHDRSRQSGRSGSGGAARRFCSSIWFTRKMTV